MKVILCGTIEEILKSFEELKTRVNEKDVLLVKDNGTVVLIKSKV